MKNKLLGILGVLLLLYCIMAPASGIWRLNETALAATVTFGLDSGNDNHNISPDDLIAQRFLNSVDNNPVWFQQADMTHAAADLSGCVYNGKLYVVGGYGTKTTDYLNWTQIYDPSTNSWSQGTPMPTARWGSSAASYDGKIYVFGGDVSGGFTTKCEIYNVETNSWSTGTDLPIGLGDGVIAATVGNYIYIFLFDTVYKFDPAGNGGLGSYRAMATPPALSQKRRATCAYINVGGQDRIYIIGGSNSVGSYTNTNYYYIPEIDTWSPAKAVAPYQAHGATTYNPVYNGKIYFGLGLGFTYAGIGFYSCIYTYDPSTNSWSNNLVNALDGGRDGIVSGFIDGKLYVVGGRNVTSNPYGLTYNECFDVSAYGTDHLTKLELLFDDTTPDGNVRLGVNEDLAGYPGNLLLDAGSVAVADGWVNISGLSLTVSPSTYYWFALPPEMVPLTELESPAF